MRTFNVLCRLPSLPPVCPGLLSETFRTSESITDPDWTTALRCRAKWTGSAAMPLRDGQHGEAMQKRAIYRSTGNYFTVLAWLCKAPVLPRFLEPRTSLEQCSASSEVVISISAPSRLGRLQSAQRSGLPCPSKNCGADKNGKPPTLLWHRPMFAVALRHNFHRQTRHL